MGQEKVYVTAKAQGLTVSVTLQVALAIFREERLCRTLQAARTLPVAAALAATKTDNRIAADVPARLRSALRLAHNTQ